MTGVTTDPNDPRLGHGSNEEPVRQNELYLVLSEEERSKGFVRPLRFTYYHEKCNGITSMGIAIAETYAREPRFYSDTYCSVCNRHRPLSEFVWVDISGKITPEVVGS